MTTTVDGIYENGKIVLPRPLSLPENSHVRVTIESDVDREAWLKLSQGALTKDWDKDADDVFNDLTAMASDPQIQRELRSIQADFAAAESDGLGKI